MGVWTRTLERSLATTVLQAAKLDRLSLYGARALPQLLRRSSVRAPAAQTQAQSYQRRAMSLPEKQGKLTIAIEGCCHGDLDNIYGTLQHLERVEGKKIDLLICCGDFQAVRNVDDLETMACPPKYRDLNTFYKYYSGEAQAPFPTLFIGGNHEAANYLWELYYGGWAAPNIYFLGYTGCVKFGGLRIGGLSGIYKQGDYTRGHDEKLPYSDGSMRSMYHIRDFEVYRLMQIMQPLDIFLTHDWPRNIANYGNKAALCSKKPFLRSEIDDGSLGSPPGEQLLHTLQPAYWFSAHLHTKFAALVQHPCGTTTRFLSLDKCLPGREFLQILELDAKGPMQFEYDEEWLAIMRSTHDLVNLNSRGRPLPGMGALRKGPQPSDLEVVREALQARGTAAVPLNFVPTAPAHQDAGGGGRGGPGFKVPKPRGRMPTQHVRNPQTESLLEMLRLPYNLEHGQGPQGQGQGSGRGYGNGFTYGQQGDAQQSRTLLGIPITPPGMAATALPPPPPRQVTDEQVAAALANPEEIDLDEGDEDDEVGAQDTHAGVLGSGGAGANGAGAATAQAAGLIDDPMFKPL